jgi:transcriptional regulator with XRE-family HTH domain
MSENPVVRPALRDLVAAEVRAEMGRRRISGAELARAIGEPQASLQRRLSGRYPFDVDLLARIADYLDVPLHELFLVGHRGGGDAAATAGRRLSPAATGHADRRGRETRKSLHATYPGITPRSDRLAA